METIIQLIFSIALLKFCLKAALSGKVMVICIYGLLLAGVSFALYPMVINQPLTILSDLLSSTVVVENMALLTTAESVVGVFISIHLLDNYFLPKAKRTRGAWLLKIIPGVIVFFAVAYFELLFFKFRVGGDFLFTALMYSGVLGVGVVALALLLRYVLDGESLKLEVKLILNLAILVLGLLVSSSVADYNISRAQTTIEWKALVAIVLGAVALIALGVWLHKINFKQKISNLIKWNK